MPHNIENNSVRKYHDICNPEGAIEHVLQLIQRLHDLEEELQDIQREIRRNHRSIVGVFNLNLPRFETIEPKCTCFEAYVHKTIQQACDNCKQYAHLESSCLIETLRIIEKDGTNVDILLKYEPYTICELHGTAPQSIPIMDEVETEELNEVISVLGNILG